MNENMNDDNWSMYMTVEHEGIEPYPEAILEGMTKKEIKKVRKAIEKSVKKVLTARNK